MKLKQYKNLQNIYSESGEEEGLQLKDSMREYLKKYILKM